MVMFIIWMIFNRLEQKTKIALKSLWKQTFCSVVMSCEQNAILNIWFMIPNKWKQK